jgi:hypothetical protein
VACDQEAQAIYRHIRQMEEASTELVRFISFILSFFAFGDDDRDQFPIVLFQIRPKMEFQIGFRNCQSRES